MIQLIWLLTFVKGLLLGAKNKLLLITMILFQINDIKFPNSIPTILKDLIADRPMACYVALEKITLY